MRRIRSAKIRLPGRWRALVALLFAATGCADAVIPPPASWETTVLADHPLTGRIWDVAAQRFVSPAKVAAALAGADFVLLGEKHDNSDHHRLQAWAIRAMAARGRRPVIALEMLDPGQEKALRAYLDANPGNAHGIGSAVGWAERGWPDWEIYRPIAAAAIDAGAPMLAGAFPRETIRQVGRDGFGVIGADMVRNLGLDDPAPEPMRAEMRSEIADSHCGYLPEGSLDPMADVQLAKDAAMAAAMRRGVALDGHDAAVLITGAGHARGDRGVPWHLRRLAPSRATVTIAFTEVQPGDTSAAAYERTADKAGAFDFLWFTPRVDNSDPCEVFADQLRRMREKRKSISPAPDG